MANHKGQSNIRNMMYNGKNSLLPPKSPLPCTSPSLNEYIPGSLIGTKISPKRREVNIHHQRTSSESVLIEEQPSWLDELLNEPETPVHRRGHRRSSSDSFVFIDSTYVGSRDFISQDDNKLKMPTPGDSWTSPNSEIFGDIQRSSFLRDSVIIKNKSWVTPVSSCTHPHVLHIRKSNLLDAGKNTSLLPEKLDSVVSGPHDPRCSYEKKEFSPMKSLSSETDTKRAKQQFAQRSRVRKLQYIAELEKNVQGLEAKGSEVSAEFEFVNQQNLILNMENKALKQRLESLTQEQLIKNLEHEVLEREVERLRSLYQKQQAPPQQPFFPRHTRANSRDLDQQFASLSLKQKELSSDRDSVTGQLHS